jgi:hypothetical protein
VGNGVLFHGKGKPSAGAEGFRTSFTKIAS